MPQPDQDSRKIYRDKNLHIVFGVTLTAIIGVSSLLPALPLMVRDIDGIDAHTVGWVITAFTLPGALFSPFIGILADRVGRKPVLVPALFVFGVFGTACFFAEDVTTLLVLRFFQGLGAAPLGVLYGTIIGDLYDGRERAMAMGLNAGVLSLGTAIFPLIGGPLAVVGWNWPFLLPALAIPLGLVVLRRFDPPEPKPGGRMRDYLRNAGRAMLTRRVLGLFVMTLVTFIILYGPLVTYFPILLHDRFAAPPHAIGAIFFMSSITMAACAASLGWITRRVSARLLLAVSGVLYLACMLLLPNMPGMWWCVLPVLLFGLAQGLNIPQVMTLLTSIATIETRAAFMAVNGTILRVSQTVAPLVMGLVMAGWGIDAVFLSGAGCAVLFILLALCCASNERLS